MDSSRRMSIDGRDAVTKAPTSQLERLAAAVCDRRGEITQLVSAGQLVTAQYG